MAHGIEFQNRAMDKSLYVSMRPGNNSTSEQPSAGDVVPRPPFANKTQAAT